MSLSVDFQLPPGIVDQRRGVAVARDFLFRTIAGRGLVDDESPDAVRGYVYALQAVRGLAGFDLGDLKQPCEGFRRLPVVEFLAAPEFADGPQRCGLLGAEPKSGQEWRSQGLHAHPRSPRNGVMITLNRVNLAR